MPNQSFRIWFAVGFGLVSIGVGYRQWCIRLQNKKQFLSKNQKEDVEKTLITIEEQPVRQLDDDLIAEILVCLPVKSLLRFRCVCKSWNSLILSDPDFAKKLEGKCLYKILETVNPIRSKDLRDTRVGETILEKQSYLQVLGSCNGLICIDDIDDNLICEKMQKDRRHLMLLNPSTLDKNKLPKHTIRFYTFYGFAYDSTFEDYKVILGHHNSDQSFSGGHYHATIEVFSLRSEAWKTTTIEAPKNVEECRGEGKLLNGNLHWVEETASGSVTIVSFDVAEGKFGELLPPPIICAEQEIGIGTAIGNCRLFLYEYDCDCHRSKRGGIAFTIWVMEEYGISESWTRHVQVPSLSLSLYNRYYYTPYWILENGEVLMERRGKRSKTMQLVSYNPEDNSQTSYSRFVHAFNMSPVLYLQTLVSPKPVHPLAPCVKLSPSWFWPWKNICKFVSISGLFRGKKDHAVEQQPSSKAAEQKSDISSYEYCEICQSKSDHETTMCPNRSEGYSTLCRICDDGPCENEAEHKDEHFEILKYCQKCFQKGNHWEEDCESDSDDEFPCNYN